MISGKPRRWPDTVFNRGCRDCPRLSQFLDDVQQRYPDYYCRPVPPFGDPQARLLIVGLAPGMHGANRTGRPFTGDHAGILLYQTLHEHGFASQPESLSVDDPMTLIDCRITNAVKCLPPDNKPVGAEINTCNRFLAGDLQLVPEDGIVIALGGIAHRAIIKALGRRQADYRFGHNQLHDLGPFQMLDSYHCSRYNTNTGRLTPQMFSDVFSRAGQLLNRKCE